MRRIGSLFLGVSLAFALFNIAFADTIYVVQPGDNLTKIAVRFNVTVAALIRANNLSNPNAIRIGQKLIIPDGAPVTPLGNTTYTVQPGDSLSRISKRFKVSIKALMTANNLRSDILQIGQVLTIPEQSPASTVPSPSETPTQAMQGPLTGSFSWNSCTTDGWTQQTYVDSLSVASVQSGSVARSGCSLQLNLNMIPQHSNLSKGEAWKDLGKSYNLTDHSLSCFVYAPSSAQGDPQSPNGAQVFVKTADFKSEYGKWKNLEKSVWTQITLVLGHGDYQSPGYSPDAISIVGIKIGTGGKASSTFTYQGPIYVDDCTLSP